MSKVSVLAKLRTLLAREAPEQAGTIREALRQTARTGREHSVVGLSNQGGAANIARGEFDTVTPDPLEILAAKMARNKNPIVDFHTHPSGPDTSLFTGPSPKDLEFYSSVWAPTKGREVRTIIATPTNRLQNLPNPTYNFFATDDTARVLDPRMFDLSRFELQKAARPGGILRKIQDDPIMRAYLESGGDLGTLIEELSPILTMSRQSQKGLGRHEFEIGNQPIKSDPNVTPTELFKRFENPSLELLRSKKFKQGGAVRSPLNKIKECSCHG